jgi:hypothetical protein
MRTSIARAWRSWGRLTPHIGNFQARVLLTLIYFTWLVPFAMLVRFCSDPLDIRGVHKPSAATAWKKRAAPQRDLQALRGQF